MALLSAVFAAAVSSVAVATRARVEAGERARERSHVLSAAGIEAPEDPQALEAVWNRSAAVKSDAEGLYYELRHPSGTLAGYVFPFQGPGFWGPISGVVAVDTGGERIIGISFIRHQETPGLGGRITEDWFRAQFQGKPLAPPPAGGPPLRFVSGKPTGPREVEAITGATQTSTRLGKFLNPFLSGVRNRPVFKRGGAG
jgi:Na+-transporting NADH:ubiquinone oxidoreductase subunit C